MLLTVIYLLFLQKIGNLNGFYLLTDGEEMTRTATRDLSEFAISKTLALEEDEMVWLSSYNVYTHSYVANATIVSSS